MPAHRGSCHCGAVSWTAETALDSMMDCNCSHCRRKGWILQPVPASDFTLDRGGDAQTAYRFNTHRIEHLFCRTCGVESFARGTDGAGAATVMINVRCLESPPALDPARITHWDGASF